MGSLLIIPLGLHIAQHVAYTRGRRCEQGVAGTNQHLWKRVANMKTKKGVIGMLTGGGDVPGLNPAIRAVTILALREGCEVIGIRR